MDSLTERYWTLSQSPASLQDTTNKGTGSETVIASSSAKGIAPRVVSDEVLDNIRGELLHHLSCRTSSGVTGESVTKDIEVCTHTSYAQLHTATERFTQLQTSFVFFD